MSEAYPGGCTAGAVRNDGGLAALGAAGWLSLAAAPTFAVMALLTGALGGGSPGMLCGTTPDWLPFGGMVPMYLLMSMFHSAAWLRLVTDLRKGDGPDDRPPDRSS